MKSARVIDSTGYVAARKERGKKGLKGRRLRYGVRVADQGQAPRYWAATRQITCFVGVEAFGDNEHA